MRASATYFRDEALFTFEASLVLGKLELDDSRSTTRMGSGLARRLRRIDEASVKVFWKAVGVPDLVKIESVTNAVDWSVPLAGINRAHRAHSYLTQSDGIFEWGQHFRKGRLAYLPDLLSVIVIVSAVLALVSALTAWLLRWGNRTVECQGPVKVKSVI
jgi:hypothetical protein